MIKIKRGGGSGSNSAMYDFFHRKQYYYLRNEHRQAR